MCGGSPFVGWLLPRPPAKMTARLSLALLAMALAFPSPSAVQYDNTKPRRDTAGAIIDAHDGNYVAHAGRWFYFAMGYGLCLDTGTVNGCVPCGSSWNNTVGVWSNAQLTNEGWTREAEVLPYEARPDGGNCTYFRSHGVLSPASGKWVVWVNAKGCSDCPAASKGACFITATADNIAGPYTYAGAVNLSTMGGMGDMDLFVDDDGAGYAVMTRIGGGVAATNQRRLVVEQLAPDFLSGLRASDTFGPSYVEAPTMFKRQGIYYALAGGCTCFGLGGAGVVVNTASSPLGPWTTRSVRMDPGCPVTRWPACSNPSCTGPGDGTCSMHHGAAPAQQNHTGPTSAPRFCGGVGGKSPEGVAGQRHLMLECLGAESIIANISFTAYGSFGCIWDNGNCRYSDATLFPKAGCSPANIHRLENASCNLAAAASIVAGQCIGHSRCTLAQGPPTFAVDPCEGTFKALFVAASCTNGSAGRVSTIVPPEPGPSIPCVPYTQAQQNYVIRVGGSGSGTNASAFIWTGDRWQTGGNGTGAAAPGLKGWDYQFWAPLEWDDSVVPPMPRPLRWINAFNLLPTR